MTSTRHTLGSALWVVSVLGVALVAANLVARVFDVGWIDPPGRGLVYMAIAFAAGTVSSVLLKEDSS